MIGRLFRYVSWFLLFFLALVAVSTIVLRLVFSPAKIRSVATAQIRTHLHREAQMGRVELHPFGMALHRLRLSEAPGFSAGTFLVVETVRVRWSLLPLLRRRLVLQEIVLENPQVNLTRLPDGKRLNISDLLKTGDRPSADAAPSAQASAPAVAPPSAPSPETLSARRWSWHIERIALRNGLIQYNDRSPTQQSTSLRQIELSIWDFTPSRMSGKISISVLESPYYKARDFSAEWQLRDIDRSFSRLNGSATVRQGKGTIENTTRLAGAGKGTNLAFLPLMLLRKVDAKALKMMPSTAQVPIDSITGSYEFDGGTMRIKSFEVTGPELQMTAEGLIQLSSGELAVNIRLQTSPSKTFTGTHLQLRLSGTLAKPKTQVESLNQKSFKATLKGLFK